MEVNDLEEIYRSIPTFPEAFEPTPLHRQHAGYSKWVDVMNKISLAREIIRQNNKETERYIWAKNILSRIESKPLQNQHEQPSHAHEYQENTK